MQVTPPGIRKRDFFAGIGFEKGDHAIFSDALLDHGRLCDLIETSVVYECLRYRVEGLLVAPRPSDMTIRTVWQDEGDTVRLVTAYPIGRRSG